VWCCAGIRGGLWVNYGLIMGYMYYIIDVVTITLLHLISLKESDYGRIMGVVGLWVGYGWIVWVYRDYVWIMGELWGYM
jgi:hypothetical protein